jgi:hypothetical protein
VRPAGPAGAPSKHRLQNVTLKKPGIESCA